MLCCGPPPRHLAFEVPAWGGEVDFLTADRPPGRPVRGCRRQRRPTRVVARWVINELPRELSDRPLDGTKLTGKGLGALVLAVESGEITGTAAKDIFAELVQRGGDPRQIIDERGLAQVSDEDAIAAIVNEVLAANADKVDLYRAGKTGLLGFFVGQVLRYPKAKLTLWLSSGCLALAWAELSS